jgi:hypothetical protein
MARDLAKIQKVKIFDSVTGEEIELSYTLPSPVKKVEYAQRLYDATQDKNVLRIFPETRVEYGKEILAGIPDNYFSIEGKVISSDPASENYREDYKELIAKEAPDILASLAEAVFEAEEQARRRRFAESVMKANASVILGELSKKKTDSADK